jgi:hypothetical protein
VTKESLRPDSSVNIESGVFIGDEVLLTRTIVGPEHTASEPGELQRFTGTLACLPASLEGITAGSGAEVPRTVRISDVKIRKKGTKYPKLGFNNYGEIIMFPDENPQVTDIHIRRLTPAEKKRFRAKDAKDALTLQKRRERGNN